MVSAHAFKRVESDPTLPLDEDPGSPVAKSPAGPAESNGQRHDEETAESIIHSSVRNVNLTFNIESSSSSTGEEGARNRKGDGGGGGFSFLGYLASCCFANPQDEPAESFGGRQNGHESGGWTPKAAHDDAKAKRMFSRNPSTPRREHAQGNTFNRIYSTNSTHYMLPPQQGPDVGKKTLVLDLDETLVHSSFEFLPDADLILPVEVAGISQDVYVRKRPGLDEFLRFVGEHYEVGVFTASVIKYADAVLDRIDPLKVVRWRLFRESCCQTSEGFYVKDLGCLGRQLEDTIIIDNSPHSYLFHPENAIGIKSFVDDRKDDHLIQLMPFLLEATGARDVRDALRLLH